MQYGPEKVKKGDQQEGGEKEYELLSSKKEEKLKRSNPVRDQ